MRKKAEPIIEKFEKLTLENYNREIDFRKKEVLANNFGTTGHIQLILLPIDQKLAELTDREKKFFGKVSVKIF